MDTNLRKSGHHPHVAILSTALIALAACTTTSTTSTTSTGTSTPTPTSPTASSTSTPTTSATPPRPSASATRSTPSGAPAPQAAACLPDVGICFTAPSDVTVTANHQRSATEWQRNELTFANAEGRVLKLTARKQSGVGGACEPGQTKGQIQMIKGPVIDGLTADEYHGDGLYVVSGVRPYPNAAAGTWQALTFLSTNKDLVAKLGPVDSCALQFAEYVQLGKGQPTVQVLVGPEEPGSPKLLPSLEGAVGEFASPTHMLAEKILLTAKRA